VTIIRKAKRYIQHHDLIRRGDLVLVGVSGGPDSVCLLRVLLEIIGGYGGRLHIIHLDHGLRGEDSAADARFVESLAGDLDIPCTVEHRPVEDLTSPGMSPQERAREVRMGFFAEAREKLGAASVALGHTADDQAETVLMRLIAAGGPGSLAGIRPRGPGGIIHPILEVSRVEVLAYLEELGQEYRTDATNLEEKYLRNRIRRRVIPPILELNPSLTKRVSSLCELLRDDEDYLAAQAAEALTEVSKGLSLDLEMIRRLPPALLRRVIVLAAREAGVPVKDFSAGHVRDVMNLLPGPPRSIDLPGGYLAEKTYDRLTFERGPIDKAPEMVREVALPGETRVPELGVVITITEAGPEEDENGEDRATALVDADRISGRLVVRNRRPGDRFRPVGLGHRQKLKDFFINLKIDRRSRDLVPVLADEEKIVWVGGMRLDERVRVTSGTRRAWRMTITHDTGE
jgi:tRNA(Ile)-lysidine synthase